MRSRNHSKNTRAGVAETDHVPEVHADPGQPGEKAAQAEAVALCDGAAATDGGHVPFIEGRRTGAEAGRTVSGRLRRRRDSSGQPCQRRRLSGSGA
jgi:hypothetical protein